MGKRIINLEFDNSKKTTGKYLVFDTETTGLPIDEHAPPNDLKNWPYVLQVAWLLFDDEHKLIEHNNSYLKQSVEIPADATNIHGITTAMMLEKGIEPSNVYNNFKKAIDNTEYLISHNIDFDIPVVHCDFLRNGMQWDFPKNKTFCTMKKGTNFCKILQGNGKYKWPTLTELYQKCFYPGYSIKKFYQDTASKNSVHDALIDACMTAQCFFKLQDLGLFRETETETTISGLSGGQLDDNFEDLHEIDKDNEFTRNDDFLYVAEIRHRGLGTWRTLKNQSEWWLDKAVEAQFKKWDEQWTKICHKTESQAIKEANLNIAEERTREAKEKQKQIDELLVCALGIDSTVNWDLLKDKKEFNILNPKNGLESELSRITRPSQPGLRELPKEPSKGLYEPKISLVDNILNPLRKRKLEEAETLYQEAMTAWKKSVDEINSFNANLGEQYEQELKEYDHQKQAVIDRFAALEKDWERERDAFNESQKERNRAIEKLKEDYFNKQAQAIIKYFEIVLNNSQYPETFPKDFNLDYDSDSRLLIVEYVLPTPDDFPTVTDVKYISAKKELKKSLISKAQLSKIYDSAIYKITLRTLHELFEADKAEALESIVFNGWVNTIDKATGKKVTNCIVTIHVKKMEFNEIALSNAEPKTCFKYLRGIGSDRLNTITAVQPIKQINKKGEQHEDA